MPQPPSFFFLFDFLNDRKDHRSAFGTFEEVLAEGVSDLSLDGVPFGDVACFAAVEDGFDAVFGFGQEAFAVSDVYEASGDDVRACEDLVAAFFEGDDDDDDAVLSKLLAVSDDDVSYVAYA